MYVQSLKQYRKEKKLTQAQIADYVGVSTWQYAKWEKVSTIPNKYIPKLSEILECDFCVMSIFDKDSLRALRVLSGLTQTELADALGVSQQIYDTWERGLNAGYIKYEDKLLMFFKNKLKNNAAVPMLRSKISGAKIFTYLDECYILISNKKLYERKKHIFHSKIKIHKFIEDE